MKIVLILIQITFLAVTITAVIAFIYYNPLAALTVVLLGILWLAHLSSGRAF